VLITRDVEDLVRGHDLCFLSLADIQGKSRSALLSKKTKDGGQGPRHPIVLR